MLPLLYISKAEHWNTILQSLAQDLSVSQTGIMSIEPEKSELSIAQMRTLIKDISYAQKELRIVAVFSFDTASAEVQNALLKTIEEPPQHTLIVLFAQNIHTVLPTILSRVTVRRREEETEQIRNQELIDRIFSSNTFGEAINSEELSKVDARFAEELSAEFIIEARKRMKEGTFPSQTIKTLLELRNLLLSNNLNPQLAIDNMLLEIVGRK